MSATNIVYNRLANNAAILAAMDQGDTPHIFPRQRPQNEAGTLPCIVLKLISESELTDSNNGPANYIESRVQVEIYARTDTDCQALKALVRLGYPDGGPLNGFYGTVAGVTVDHIFKDECSDFDTAPEDGRAKAPAQTFMDFMVVWYPA